jgi:hypothetical protein
MLPPVTVRHPRPESPWKRGWLSWQRARCSFTVSAMSDSLNLPPNYSCVLLRKKVISVEPTPHPELKDDNVLVKVMVTDK